MKQMLIVMLLVGAMLCVTGCVNGKPTLQETQFAVYGGSYLGGLATTKILVGKKKVDVDDVKKVVEALQAIIPPLEQLEAKENLYISVYPTVEKIILKKLDKPSQQSLALAAAGIGLRLADQVVKDHPDVLQDRDKWAGFLKQIIQGLTLGMLDAIAEPADSASRDGLTRKRHENSTTTYVLLHQPACGCGMCRQGGLASDPRRGRLAYADLARSAGRQLLVSQ